MMRWAAMAAMALATATLVGAQTTVRAEEPAGNVQAPWAVLLNPTDSYSIFVLHNGKIVAQEGLGGWGPKWGWTAAPTSKARAENGALHMGGAFNFGKNASEIVNVATTAVQSAPDAITWTYTLSAKQNVPLTMIKLGFSTPRGEDGKIELAGKTNATVKVPIARASGAEDVTKATFDLKDEGTFVATFEPAVNVVVENGDLRVQLAHDEMNAGEKTIKMTLQFPQAVTFAASNAQMSAYIKPIAGADWFPWIAKNPPVHSEIGFEDWLDKPAGKHGGVRMEGDHFQFADGTPVKFWGVNLAYGTNCAPAHEVAAATAKRFAKYGVNVVRLHKFTNSGWEGIGDPHDATKMEPKGMERLDYFAEQLRQQGVYYGWSHTYHLRVEDGNRGQVLDYDELKKNGNGDTYGLTNFAPDLQDLMIQRVVNLLKHQNPYTHTTYAKDPCLAYIELQNEDDIFFYTSEAAYKSHPTYAKDLRRRFGDWLAKKYGSQDALNKAWGGALKPNEKLGGTDIAVETNPWFFSSSHLPQTNGGERQRLLDNAEFLHDVQDSYYQRFVKAIREAGYEGPICGSPWQAPAEIPHYYNLLSDDEAGWIDRHNYYEGGIFGTMLQKPGSGYLSSGLQQVADRPFGLSEWIHVYPDLYSAEGPVLLAAYGMGLQGWDSSFEFQSSARGGWPNVVGSFAYGVWDADTPTNLGQYPLLARMVMRGDVQQGDVISTRNVSLEQLETGKLGFEETVEQQGDIKRFGGTVPAEALAAGRCVVAFTKTPEPSTFPDMNKYTKGDVLAAETGQLAWNTSDKPEVTVNTEGTKAIVGFARDAAQKLGAVTITSHVPYASIIVTAKDKGQTLANDPTALVSAIARNANSGFEYFTANDSVVNNGKGPILLEPVKATIVFTRPVAEVRVLDQDGRLTGRQLAVENNTVEIDTGRDRTMYYEVVFR